jgi:DNA-binding beta-propeller fold protein YncE
MVYSAFRYQRTMVSSTIVELDPDDLEPGQSCIGPGEIGKKGGVLCDPRYQGETAFFAGGISPSQGAGSAQIGDMAFSADGNELFAVQTNPGGLLRVDTSVDISGNPREVAAGVVEVCPRATAMEVYRDGQDDYALVSCYRSAAVFVVDLNTLNVVGNIQPGTGPHHITADLAREVVYVANTLEETISVVDMARSSPARFNEIARIGLQEPYSSD